MSTEELKQSLHRYLLATLCSLVYALKKRKEGHENVFFAAFLQTATLTTTKDCIFFI